MFLHAGSETVNRLAIMQNTHTEISGRHRQMEYSPLDRVCFVYLHIIRVQSEVFDSIYH